MTDSPPATAAACVFVYPKGGVCGITAAYHGEERGIQTHDFQPAATEPKHVKLAGRWRVGRKVGRTIYAQQGPEPSDDDPLIGVMDHPALAALAVECRNRSLSDA